MLDLSRCWGYKYEQSMILTLKEFIASNLIRIITSLRSQDGDALTHAKEFCKV